MHILGVCSALLHGCLSGLLWCVLCASGAAMARDTERGTAPDAPPVAATVLWLTGEVTPGARTALVRQALQAQGLALEQVDLPFAMGTQPDAALQARFAQALARASAVWVDVPHPSVAARLKKAWTVPLQAWQAAHPQAWVVWVPGEGAHAAQGQGAAPAWPPTQAADAVAAWLSAGGGRNVGWAARWQARQMAHGKVQVQRLEQRQGNAAATPGPGRLLPSRRPHRRPGRWKACTTRKPPA